MNRNGIHLPSSACAHPEALAGELLAPGAVLPPSVSLRHRELALSLAGVGTTALSFAHLPPTLALTRLDLLLYVTGTDVLSASIQMWLNMAAWLMNICHNNSWKAIAVFWGRTPFFLV